MDPKVEAEWQRLVEHDNEPHVRAIASCASREPVLRRLFPFASLRNLRFSTTSEWPYDFDLPYVLTTPLDGYEARDGDGAPLLHGALDEVVATVAERMAVVLAKRAP